MIERKELSHKLGIREDCAVINTRLAHHTPSELGPANNHNSPLAFGKNTITSTCTGGPFRKPFACSKGSPYSRCSTSSASPRRPRRSVNAYRAPRTREMLESIYIPFFAAMTIPAPLLLHRVTGKCDMQDRAAIQQLCLQVVRTANFFVPCVFCDFFVLCIFPFYDDP